MRPAVIGPLALLLALLVAALWYGSGARRTPAQAEASAADRADVRAEVPGPSATPLPQAESAAPADRVASSTRADASVARLRIRFVDSATRRTVPYVLFHAWGDPRVRHTDSSGELSFRPASLEPIAFEAVADGYCVVRGELESFAQERDVPTEVALVRSSPIHGRVVHPDGSPVPYAIVGASVPDGSPREEPRPDGLPDGWVLAAEETASRTLADWQGRFELPGMVPFSATHVVRATATGCFDGALPVTARGSGVPVYLEIVLQPEPTPGVLTGRVFLDGKPLRASLRARSGTREQGGESDEDGSYRIDELPPGPAELVATPLAWTGQGPDLGGNAPTVEILESGVTSFDLHLALSMRPISGRVTFAGGLPVEGIGVAACSRDLMVQSVTDALGNYALRVPDDGAAYSVAAMDGQFILDPIRLAPEASGADLVVRPRTELVLEVRDATTGGVLSGYQVFTRPTGFGTSWNDRGETPWKRSEAGAHFHAPAEPFDLQVHLRRYRVAKLQGVVPAANGPTRLEIELRVD